MWPFKRKPEEQFMLFAVWNVEMTRSWKDELGGDHSEDKDVTIHFFIGNEGTRKTEFLGLRKDWHEGFWRSNVGQALKTWEAGGYLPKGAKLIYRNERKERKIDPKLYDFLKKGKADE